MLRRAVLMLMFGAGLPILALSYMALRSINSELGEEQRKAQALAQGAAKSLADRLDEQLEHIERSLLGHVRDALRQGPSDPEEEAEVGEAPLNVTGRVLVASLERLRLSEPLVRQGFLVHGTRLLHPWAEYAPTSREPDQNE